MKAKSLDKPSRTAAQERFLLRLGLDHFLRQAVLVSAPFEGDILLGAVFAAISQGTVRHLNEPLRPSPLATDGVFPDGMRRTVTIAWVARTLSLPRETARRYVHRLVALGYCRAVGPRGVMVPAEALRSEPINRMAQAHAEALRELLAAFDQAGLAEAT